MQPRTRYAGIFIICLLALLSYRVWFGSGLKNPEAVFAHATQVQGEVVKLDAQGVVIGEVHEGDALEIGDTILTIDDAVVTLEFADQSKVLVSAKSQLSMVSLYRSKETGETETVVRLDKGSIESRVHKSSGFTPRYKVITPAMQLAVRGTQFVVSVDPLSGRAQTMVTEGEVAAAAAEQELSVSAGFSSSAERGEAPSAPKPLPAATEIASHLARFETLPLDFSWDTVEGAERYRVQILGGESFDQLLFDQKLEQTALQLDSIPNGDYRLRVRAIDREGIEGHNALSQFTQDAQPYSPTPTGPIASTTVRNKKIRFYWDGVPSAKQYLFQISDRWSFQDVTESIEAIPGDHQGVALRLESGQYYWRIATIDERGVRGPFSAPQRFIVE